MQKYFIVIAVAIVLGVAWYALSPLLRNVEMDEASPLANLPPQELEDPGAGNGQGMTEGVLARAEFVPKAHDVEGQAQLIRVGDEYTVRFENFKTINGPDVNIYLATDTSAEDFVDLGDIKATEGNVNYTVPADTDFTKYDTVLVWCKDFSVLFSYAELENTF
jgi:hypothetical protein